MPVITIVDTMIFEQCMVPVGCKVYESNEDRLFFEAVQPIQSKQVYIADREGLSKLLTLVSERKIV